MVDEEPEPDVPPATAPPSDPSGEDRDSSPEDLPSANEILGTLFQEASLWPLVTVLLGSTGAFGAALIVLATSDHNIFAAAALLLLSGMSVDVLVRARRRPETRNVAKLVALFWVTSIALALVAIMTGIA